MPKQQSTPTLNENLQFLVHCCKTSLSKKETLCILSYLNTSREDAEALIAFSHIHGVLPVVYKTIKRLQENHPIPSSTFDIQPWKSAYQDISKRNMFMTAELLHVMKILEENNIEALAFKGPTLSQMAYGDITLRQYGDLDILVNEDRLYDAALLLSKHHYIPDIPLPNTQNKTFLSLGHDYALYSDHVVIELHWSLMRKNHILNLNTLDVWKDINPVNIHGKEVNTFSNEALLIYLCFHATKHLWARIEWITDIDRLIRNDDLNWDKTIKLCKEANALTTLQLGLSLSTFLFHTKLPEFIEKAMRNRTTIQGRAIIVDVLNSNDSHKQEGFHIEMKKYTLLRLLNNQSISKLSIFFNILFDYSAYDYKSIIKLPKYLSFLYLLLRPIHLIQKNIKRYWN